MLCFEPVYSKLLYLLKVLIVQSYCIMGDDWGGDDAGAVREQYSVVAEPDIKLFGKWSTIDVQVSDISLSVSSPLAFRNNLNCNNLGSI